MACCLKIIFAFDLYNILLVELLALLLYTVFLSIGFFGVITNIMLDLVKGSIKLFPA